MTEIKNGVGVPVKASPSDEIVLTNAPDHEKQLKRIFALLNAGGEPARITEELAQTIVDDVADMQMNHNGMEDALKHERAETKILSVALSEIYRSLYGYEPTRLFPIEDTMTNIRSRIEQLKSGPKYTQQDNAKAKEKILELTECLRGEPFAGDASSLTLEEAIDLLSIAIANRLPAATNKEAMNLLSIALAKRRSRGAIKPSTEDDELPRTKLEEFVEGLYEVVYSVKPVCVGEHIIDNLYKRLENIVRKDKEERGKCTKLEREIARLNYQTSKLRFSENSALEKKAEVWAIKAIEYRILLSTVERRLRGMWTPEPAAANTVSMSDVEDMADLIAEGIGKS